MDIGFDLYANSTMNYKSDIYIASKLGVTEDDYMNQIEEYDTPVPYCFNVQPITQSSELAEFGELSRYMKRAVVSKSQYLGVFKEFDKAYLDGITPENETINGENANYRIYSIRPQNVVLMIYFEKIVKGDE